MKQLAPILAAVFFGAIAGYVLKPGSDSPDGAKPNTAQQRKNEQQANARNNQVKVVTVPGETRTVSAEISTSPEEIIEELKLIRPTGDTRQQSMREIIHYMVSLTKANEKALPAIDAFLASRKEIEYEGTALAFRRQREEAAEAAARGEEAEAGGLARLLRSGIGGFIGASVAKDIRRELTPRSMRLGLFYVLADIGGDQAETILARELAETLRGLEVAFLDHLLAEMVSPPDKYKAKVLEVTHELLTNPPATDGNSLLDEASRMFLFAILIKYNDATFVDTAKTMIINAKGRVDGAVVNYLATLLGVQAVPLLHAKLNDPALTNDGDKMALSAAILQHVGVHPSSDSHFKEVVLNKEIGGLRYLAVANLSGGDQSEATLRNRQKLIADIKEESDDPVLNGMLDRTHNRIEVTLDPSKKEELTPERGEGFRNLLDLYNQGANPGNDQ